MYKFQLIRTQRQECWVFWNKDFTNSCCGIETFFNLSEYSQDYWIIPKMRCLVMINIMRLQTENVESFCPVTYQRVNAEFSCVEFGSSRSSAHTQSMTYPVVKMTWALLDTHFRSFKTCTRSFEDSRHCCVWVSLADGPLFARIRDLPCIGSTVGGCRTDSS